MFALIKELFSLLTPSQRRRFCSLQILVILMAIMELMGIASIGPFMALVADPALLDKHIFLGKLYAFSGLASPNRFLFATGVGVLIMLGLASIISIVTTWRMSLFAFGVGTEIADRLYQHYLAQPWLFHAQGSSAQLTKQISTEANRVTQQIIQPLIHFNSRLVLAVLISGAILLYNPIIALSGLAIFVSGYVLIYTLVRHRIAYHGRKVSSTNTQRFKLMNEGFGGIKDVLLLGRSRYFIEQFNKSGKVLARAQGVNSALTLVPRYFMELLAFGAVIGLVLLLLKLHHGVLSQALPMLAVYTLAGFKLLPALQQIYGSVTQIKGNMAAFESIKADLEASVQDKTMVAKDSVHTHAQIQLSTHHMIHLQNITFTYPGKDTPALNNINIKIPINAIVGFVGESGSGKSTAVDLILGLIEPDQGQLMLDELVIGPQNKRAWQNNIGFVPQSIFLSEDSIAKNIAFGLDPQAINMEQVEKAMRLASLEELVHSLPHGLDTRVGERGVQLSGGQRQRIGIARALYNNGQLLIFDEATSALDGITEKVIMDAIHALSGQRTIVLIAHRLKTVKHCDLIYFMDHGQVVDQGTYEQLLERNERFQKMARLA